MTLRTDEPVDPTEQSAAQDESTAPRVRHFPFRPSFALGEILAARYKILRFIARGGMGEVYEAEDLELRENVALKTIRSEIARDLVAMESFKNEVQLARKVTHPNVCRIFDISHHTKETGERIAFLTMELLRGERLSDLLRREGRLPAERALPLVDQFAAALDAAHKAGVVHRDFKSGNVMLVPSNANNITRVVVTDFGLARLAACNDEEEQLQEGRISGTPSYLAPEQIEAGEVSARTDIYAMGIVMYEMLTGVLPFSGETPESIANRRLTEPPPSPRNVLPEIGTRWEKTILRCLERNPADRYASALEVIDALHARSGLRRTVLSALAGIVLIAALVMIFIQFRLPHEPHASYKSVAVLPIKNSSPSQDSFLSDSISEAVIVRLSQLSQLRVSPWMTAMRYKNASQSPQAIARELQVDSLLTGTMRQQSDNILATLSLIDAKTGLQIWGSQFSARTSELIGLEREITLATATALKGRLPDTEKRAITGSAPESAQAYEFYLRGRSLSRKPDRQSNDLAIDLYRKALEYDSTLAEAHVGIGDVEWNRYYYAWDPNPAKLDIARSEYERALRLNPSLASGYAGLLWVDFLRSKIEDCLKDALKARKTGKRDVETLFVQVDAYLIAGLHEKIPPLLDEILRLDPANRQAFSYRVGTYSTLGDYQRSIREATLYFKRFGEDWPRTQRVVAEDYHCLGNFPEAERYYQKAIRMSPGEWQFYLHYGYLLQQLHENAKAESILREGLGVINRNLEETPESTRFHSWRAIFYGYLEDKSALDQETASLLDQAPGNASAMSNLGVAYAALGDADRAVELLLESLRLGYGVGDFLPIDKGMPNLNRSHLYPLYEKKMQETLGRFKALY